MSPARRRASLLAPRVALLSYRGNPHSGGQGVYVRHLATSLAAQGAAVEVLSGPPYPDLATAPSPQGGDLPGLHRYDDPRPDAAPAHRRAGGPKGTVRLTAVPSLDLYREPDPFRRPRFDEFRSAVDVLEYAIMCTAGFPEPLTFSLRLVGLFRARERSGVPLPDIVHDNQGLGYGLLALQRRGLPVIATVHHPITVDRQIDLRAARTLRQRVTLQRWYGFVRMQGRVLRRLPRILTVSSVSAAGIERAFGLPTGRVATVPIGVDTAVFRPRPEIRRRPGRLIAVTGADVALKGLVPLLEAFAKIRVERDAELVVVGRQGEEAKSALERLEIAGAVTFETGVTTGRLVELFAESEAAVVPSLYEGFSLPAVEAMACGVPLVATTGGALPEVVGTDGRTGVLVPPGDADAMAMAIVRLLNAPGRRAAMGLAGRARVQQRFTWRRTAERTLDEYRGLIDSRPPC